MLQPTSILPAPSPTPEPTRKIVDVQVTTASPPASSHNAKRRSPAIDDNSPAPPPSKHPYRIAYPRPDIKVSTRSNANAAPGLSKQAVSKRKALNSIQNRMFIRDPKRWGKFKRKITDLDPSAEIPDDPSHVLSVKHFSCGSWFRMSVPYNTERLKTHVKSCTSSATRGGMGGMKTLHKYGVMVLDMKTPTGTHRCPPESSSPTPPVAPSLPCPGIAEKDDARIGKYIERVFLPSAGGKDVRMIARELFSGGFAKLSSERKDIVRQQQIKTHRWSIDYIRKCIHAIGARPCRGTAQLGLTTDERLPCDRCLGLLSLRMFRNSITREVPKDENRVYVPHIYQPAEFGRMYSSGFSDLINGVCPMY